MAIKDLEARQGKVDITAEVVEVGDTREFSKFGRTGKVATAIIKDESGEIKLSLWNEQIDQVKAGDKIHITNGYVNEFQGEKQLTTGRFGNLEVIEGAGSGEGKKETKAAKKAGKPEKEEAEEEALSPEIDLSEELDVEEERVE